MSKQIKLIRQSIVSQQLFDPEGMEELFGDQYPTLEKRTAIFFEKWMDWRPHRLVIAKDSATNVRRLCKDIGMKELFDFQCRNGEVRFCSKEQLAMALLNGLKEYKHV